MIDRRTFNVGQYVADTKENIEDMKSSQPVSGDSFINYPCSSDLPSDIGVTVPASGYRAVRVTFTHDEPGTYNIVSMRHFLRIDNPEVMESPYTPTPSGTVATRRVTERPAHGMTTWLIDIANTSGSSHTIYLKLFFTGTVSGTFSVVQI